MEIVIGIIVVLVLVFIFGGMANNRPVQDWSDEKLARMHDKLLHVASLQTPLNKGEHYAKAKEVENEIKRRAEKNAATYKDNENIELSESSLVENIQDKISDVLENSMGLPTDLSRESSGYIINESLDILKVENNPYSVVAYNALEESSEYHKQLIEAGLNKDEIFNYWKRPMLLVIAESKLLDIIQYSNLKNAEEKGKDLNEAAMKYKKYCPRYGNPNKWDSSDKFNQGLTDKDISIFKEFSNRIDKWIEVTPYKEIDNLIEKHGTLNAAFNYSLNNIEIKETSKNDGIVIPNIIRYLSEKGRLISD